MSSTPPRDPTRDHPAASADHGAPVRYRFGDFSLEPRPRRLLRAGRPITIQRQPFRVLELLVARAGDVVTRDEFQRAIWPDVHVDFEHNLNFCINQVRRALGDQAANPEYIETVTKLGYRFVKPVSEAASPGSEGVEPGRRTAWPRSRVAWLAGPGVLLVATAGWLASVGVGWLGWGIPRPATNRTPDAREAFVLGRSLAASESPHVISRSIALFREAIRDDPAFAPARLGLAEAYLNLGTLRALPPRQALAESEAAARSALLLDPNSAKAHVLLGMSAGTYRYDFWAARRHLRRAVELEPTNMDAHSLLAFQLARDGSWDEALAEMNRALELEPLDYGTMCQLGLFEYLAGQPVRGIERLRALLVGDPALPRAAHFLGLIQLDQGDVAGALASLQRAVDLQPYWQHQASLGFAHARSGDPGAARRALVGLAQHPDSEYGRAVVLAGLGEAEEAVSLLEDAQRKCDPMVAYLGMDLRFRILTGHPAATRLFKSLDVRLVLPAPAAAGQASTHRN